MKQLNNNTFGKNSWRRYWEKLCFLRNTLEKIPGVATNHHNIYIYISIQIGKYSSTIGYRFHFFQVEQQASFF